MSYSSKFIIAFGPPEYSRDKTVAWENYFKDTILPQLSGDGWFQEKDGWGWLETQNMARVNGVLTRHKWKKGKNYWGGIRYDPLQQEPPDQIVHQDLLPAKDAVSATLEITVHEESRNTREMKEINQSIKKHQQPNYTRDPP